MAMIDIIVRTKDRPHLLRRALTSIFNQTYQDWRIILVNDCGNIYEVNMLLTKYDTKLTNKIHRIDNTISKDRAGTLNQALKISQATYIACLDDDDTWHPDFLTRMLNEINSFQAFPIVGAACGTTMIEEIETKNNVIERKRKPFIEFGRSALSLPLALSNNLATINALLLRKDAIDAVGGYDESLAVLEDWDLLVRILMKHDIITVPEILAYYHIRPNATTNTANSNAQGIHQMYRERLYNHWLRRALNDQNVAWGTAAAIVRQMNEQTSYIVKYSCLLRRIKDRIKNWIHFK